MFADPSDFEIRYVCNNMSERSKEDVFGASTFTVQTFSEYLITSNGFKWAGYHEGAPVLALMAPFV
ncbi:hypothetical protein P7F88_25520 [Vibrio hannami]|uniref:hypothetical protein n=1 Tax=Vibrio hannami TaxID=2717094 RepID=UPI00240EB9D7|nr:hypothetical protein [Vibrio hannami]MDG3089226.1 hypothetical protein [Vibrio hannami]